MKAFIIVVCAFACLWIEANADCAGLHDNAKGEKTYKTGETMIDKCSEFKCQEDGSWFSAGCGVWTCEDKIGYQDYDYSKPYPECCPRPICKSDQKE